MPPKILLFSPSSFVAVVVVSLLLLLPTSSSAFAETPFWRHHHHQHHQHQRLKYSYFFNVGTHLPFFEAKKGGTASFKKKEQHLRAFNIHTHTHKEKSIMPLTDLTNRNYPTKSSSLSTWEECDDVLQRQRRSTNTFNVKVPAKQHPSGKRTNTKNTGGRTTVKLTDVFPSKSASEKEEEEDFFASSGKDEAVIIVATKGTYSLRRHHPKKL